MNVEKKLKIVKHIFEHRFGKKDVKISEAYVQEWLGRVAEKKYYLADSTTLKIWKEAEELYL